MTTLIFSNLQKAEQRVSAAASNQHLELKGAIEALQCLSGISSNNPMNGSSTFRKIVEHNFSEGILFQAASIIADDIGITLVDTTNPVEWAYNHGQAKRKRSPFSSSAINALPLGDSHRQSLLIGKPHLTVLEGNK